MDIAHGLQGLGVRRLPHRSFRRRLRDMRRRRARPAPCRREQPRWISGGGNFTAGRGEGTFATRRMERLLATGKGRIIQQPCDDETVRGAAIVSTGILVLLLAALLSAQGTPPPTPLTLLSRDGRRATPTTIIGGQEFIALDDVVTLFQVAVKEDTLARGITVTYRGRTVVLSADQPMASVSGRVIALPAPPVRAGNRWLVPIHFLPRALGPIDDSRIEDPSRRATAGRRRRDRRCGARLLRLHPLPPLKPPRPPRPRRRLPEAPTGAAASTHNVARGPADDGHRCGPWRGRHRRT